MKSAGCEGVPVLAVTGYSDSGKTTLIERLVPLLRQRGYRVGVIKHQSHVLNLDTPGKDSYRFWQSGADAVGMFAPERTVMMWRRGEGPNLRAAARLMAVDLVLAEGFKESALPRLLLAESPLGEALSLADGREVVAFVSCDDASEMPEGWLSRNDVYGIVDRIEHWLRGELE